jgi:S-adenosylmethionine:tRNA ribosyltransferase-isomerase
MPLALFDYELPEANIAQHPVEPRDHSRLMVLEGDGAAAHSRFIKLAQHLRPGDLLVVNRTRVIPARLRLRKPTGGEVELLLYEPTDQDRSSGHQWRALGKPAKSLTAGLELTTAQGTSLTVVGREGDSVIVAAQEPILGVLQREGSLPLPPYLQDANNPSAEDAAAYQSIFGAELGAVAAPTASLHFTPRVMAQLKERGVKVREVLLHVGPGTFLPVRPEHADDVRGHQMHAEWYTIDDACVRDVEATRAQGGRVVAVGTTSLRALETWRATGETTGNSTLFITPGYVFGCVDALVTNFHLPKSTLLMLVCAMAGRDRMLAAYAEAIRTGYRFYSFGDAMLIAP